MKKTARKGIWWFVVTFVMALFVIFFVGSKVVPGTGATKTILTLNGVNHFKKGLDLAGGVRLTYKIDFSKYEELYRADENQLLQVKKTAQDIILQNIDKRISTLGVSDYNSYVQKLSDGEYLVVEIGGIQDLEAAKALIGKTVELEFKVPNEATTQSAEQLADRQKLAEDVFTAVTKENASMQDLGSSKGSQDVYYNNYSDVTENELPMIYKSHLADLTKLETGAVYPTLLSGTYHITVTAGDNSESAIRSLDGFTVIRYLGKKTNTIDQLTSSDVQNYLGSTNLGYEMVDEKAAYETTKTLQYNADAKTLVYVGDEILPGTEGYKANVYTVNSGVDTETALAQVEKNDTSNVSPVAEGWKSKADITALIPSFSYDEKKPVAAYKELDATYIVAVLDTKNADQKDFPVIKIKNVATQADADKLTAEIKTRTLYSFEDLYVANTLSWTAAKDPKSDAVLNGAFFKYANVGQSQTGLPVVSIQFDDQGKEIFCNLTEQHIGKQMAIFVGGKLMTAPVIRDKICGGTAQIDGAFDIKGAKQLADDLNSGALPAPLLLSHEETIAPSLGQNALNSALFAAACGLVIVYFLMMRMYGRKKANIALIGLISFLVYLLAIFKLLGIVSSLSGIAAIILSLGMAVDSNVLIYERIREELKEGKNMNTAIEEGYERSWAPIKDGNITAGIIGLLLFFVGVNVFKGFGTTMIINTLLILFVIVPLTKELLHLFYPKK